MERTSGVLLNISSLPGEYGIGGFSKDCDRFVEEISRMGFHWWQTLPITVIGAGNSPYSGYSAYAGNYLYIDLKEIGLLTEEELNEFKYRGDIYLANYEYAKATKKSGLRIAYSRLDEEHKVKIADFVKQHSSWLVDYALYMVIKAVNDDKAWCDWEEKYRNRDQKALKDFQKTHAEELGYYYFEQYEFYRQWARVKEVAKSYNVGIIGDIPIYMSYDSVDVWCHKHLFQLDNSGRMKKVAGVPPDYFSQDGQLWGNPLYDYKEMEKDGYKWWVNRIEHNLKLYDMLRVDHFRGLYEYWSVDADATTAKIGKWEKGPQMKLWDAVKKVVKNPRIIAEDLGTIDEKVVEYVKKTGFPCMRVLQFGFDGQYDNMHLPHSYSKNTVAYTGTHDNDTALGWLYTLDDSTRQSVLWYLGLENISGWGSGGGFCPTTKCMMRAIIASSADLAIVPVQDMCGYGGDTRMNVPGIAEGNWKYRTNYGALSEIDTSYLYQLNNIYGRNNKIKL